MTMTREEAINALKEIKDRAWGWHINEQVLGIDYDEFIEIMDAVLSFLAPVSREQVERMFPGCKMCSGWNTIKLKPCVNGDLGVQADIGSAGKWDTFGLVVYSHLLASGYVDFPFCPFCGKPKTDEAVEMVMERLEVLHGKT